MDCLFFAPVGVATAMIEALPNASQRGKDKINSQITSARFVGSFVVKQAQDQIQRALGQTIGQIGVFGGLDRANEEPFVAQDSTSEGSSDFRRSDVSESVELSIASYDNLSASQIVQRLGGLSLTELQAIRDYEISHRNRRTILVRIEQLSSRSSDQ